MFYCQRQSSHYNSQLAISLYENKLKINFSSLTTNRKSAEISLVKVSCVTGRRYWIRWTGKRLVPAWLKTWSLFITAQETMLINVITLKLSIFFLVQPVPSRPFINPVDFTKHRTRLHTSYTLEVLWVKYPGGQ